MTKIAIIGAMDLETEQLKALMTIGKKKVVAGITFFDGKLKEQDVIVATCGVGKVNAAVCTQIMISEFGAGTVINTGVSGAIHHSLNVGDIVISTDCLQHDVDCTAFGYSHGMIPRMETSVFPADAALVELAYAVSQAHIKDHQVFKGRIVSGDQFVASPDRKDFIEKVFSAYTTEMEGASIAHVCHLNQVPFVIIRAMSDKADGSAHVNFDEFAVMAAENSNRIVLGMLDKI
ncbi:5'-methylthioadenosine/adenosylhomocysteine nucleosidase [Acidaminobacter sp.]|uniref:5'-methylthioadenosine/adenosylhomocysteine nucleosidase n=1 Tax=Acidaminobacter sp. TaxID=1872102 RepID=UPI00137C4EF8|nr:5'-methylthioadenosine/adenosylhomocysteine nucleosidase [Acidaminobacter sp.]MDK9711099.1 5'-methylthioadenosine/adenosylhomocysteine nucleosidase [Acidaminobacter sp.]MZQ97361.1 5'-methylthioadenosine/adenosylhomocysteine nucleosidase [Acidaminobacter sp.]